MGPEGFAEHSNQSQEYKKDCANGIKERSKFDRNKTILDRLSEKNNCSIGFDSTPAEALKESQGAARSKRKRALIDGKMLNDKASIATECSREMDWLFEYYKELSAQRLNFETGKCPSNNSLIACLLEESSLSFSKLVEVIYEKLTGKEGVTLAYVRSMVLSIGQRMMYGITKECADVLEDESESGLWCWESRDMKLLPANQRGDLNSRRLGRKKIHERISALSAVLSALAISENHDNYKNSLNKASMKLGKTLNLEEICSLVEKNKQKNDTNMAEKAAKLKEKESNPEIQKERAQNEKEIKRLQDEAEKETKRREKEEAEFKKQLKKQQEEAEKDKKRREMEENQLKKERSLKKQATIMERFLKTQKCNTKLDNENKESTCNSLYKTELINATTSLMDNAFSSKESFVLSDLCKMHFNGWKKLTRCNRACCWGVRRNPKNLQVKEFKLHESPTNRVACDKNLSCESSFNKLADGPEKPFCNDDIDTASLSVRFFRKKLLQFDKSNRPAYYGTWSKKSCAVGPRHPFKKDPDLNYDVDSDEEWEEEEPGESLSDCEEDNDEECAGEENLKLDDEEESEDEFFVPDGYLSENEGVGKSYEIKSMVGDEPEVESEELKVLLQQQKYLQNLTEHALRKGHPLVILNLTHEKTERKPVEDINGNLKMEQMCLQALCMQSYLGGCIMDLSADQCPENKDEGVSQSQNNSSITPSPTTKAISDADLLEFVSSIRSNSQGINKVLESLQGKFPSTSKKQLRNKVREISDYVDNRWQVKNEVLYKLGLSTSTEKGVKRKGITSFFTKRCLPPKQESIDSSNSSLVQCSKTKVLSSDDNEATILQEV